MLISLFLNGKLPWFDARSDAECKSRKIACDIKALSSQNNCPEVITQFFFMHVIIIIMLWMTHLVLLLAIGMHFNVSLTVFLFVIFAS